MESTDKKILVPIDDDPSTTKAVSVAVNRAKSWMNAGLSVSMVLINLYSAFDVIGRQENDGKLAMDQAESFVSASGIKNVAAISDSTFSTKGDITNLLEDHHFDLIVVGETAYTSSPDPDSFLASAWSWVVNTVTSPLPQHLMNTATCPVLLVSSAGTVQGNPAASDLVKGL